MKESKSEAKCAMCGKIASCKYMNSDNKVASFCKDCEKKILKDLENKTKNINYKKAIIFGTLSGIISAFVWAAVTIFTGWQIGLVSVAVGWIVGQAILFGSDNKRSEKLQRISALITFLAIFIGYYFIENHFIYQYLIGFSSGIPYFAPIDLVFKVMFSSFREIAFMILFTGIAMKISYAKIKVLSLQKVE